ncbi:homeobox protein Hox-A2-like [Contarinia nasturtii]|uniref:homeobox protein Hox-A2-like n=1 Tax=Contarinia nasturtii TaxID=265458 RepID=UPI0012D4995F|nr:homeobox protein Hox-A2-like [Contarinia nasturtii]
MYAIQQFYYDPEQSCNIIAIHPNAHNLGSYTGLPSFKNVQTNYQTTEVQPPVILGRTGKPKRSRTNFNLEQLNELEKAYKRCNYMKGKNREEFAKRLRVKGHNVKVWFQNRRAKDKRENQTSFKATESTEASEATETSEASEASSVASFAPYSSIAISPSSHLSEIIAEELEADLMEYYNFQCVKTETDTIYRPIYGTYIYNANSQEVPTNEIKLEDVQVQNFNESNANIDNVIDANLHDFNFAQLQDQNPDWNYGLLTTQANTNVYSTPPESLNLNDDFLIKDLFSTLSNPLDTSNWMIYPPGETPDLIEI